MMDPKPLRILVVDDEPAMRRGICVALAARGYTTEEARSGHEALVVFGERRPDIVLLDINLPGMDGNETCRRIRSADSEAGIVMITVRDSEDDTVRALEAGADDYITKPFRVRELLARISAISRRAVTQEAPEFPLLTTGDLALDVKHRLLRKSGEEIHLSPIEFSLLLHLMQNANVPLHHTRLLRAVWGVEYGQELEYLRTYIRMLRRKIEDDPAHPRYILTEPWLGYKFSDPEKIRPLPAAHALTNTQ